MNLVGHVAAAPDASDVPVEFLVGCMLPDLAAIARVRLARPGGDLGRGVEFHHACDAVFHESEWFRRANAQLRDALLDAGVTTGAARACSHAGVEMLLDGGPRDARCRGSEGPAHARRGRRVGRQSSETSRPTTRAVWVERLHMIGSSLEPRRYADARFVAERLHRMTAGRRRIELSGEHVDLVAAALVTVQPPIVDAAPDVVASVREVVPIPHHLV